jgi:hypothetical protein
VTTSTRLGLIDDIVISIVLFLVVSLRNTDGTVIQGANSQGIADIPKIIPETKSMWILDEISVLEMVEQFGPPVDELNISDF